MYPQKTRHKLNSKVWLFYIKTLFRQTREGCHQKNSRPSCVVEPISKLVTPPRFGRMIQCHFVGDKILCSEPLSHVSLHPCSDVSVILCLIVKQTVKPKSTFLSVLSLIYQSLNLMSELCKPTALHPASNKYKRPSPVAIF